MLCFRCISLLLIVSISMICCSSLYDEDTDIYSHIFFSRLLFSDAAGPRPEPEPEFNMELPDMTLYKDIHFEMKNSFPKLTQARLEEFFECCGKPWDPKFEQLYRESYCRYIRKADASDACTYVKACVWAEMRKSVSYTGCSDCLQ